ncbi:hypothetical protein [Yinghuangia seranimata]|uniref:hypothetical protein n=1 Tax=Yinghuangia seranimata TaxID=408067 RepID=UPI00248CD1B6|nr:hypothetical protein [Yinghuangia seranimata]MDI2129601.1 hypothetical protein [Yinghuangia seranimata]
MVTRKNRLHVIATPVRLAPPHVADELAERFRLPGTIPELLALAEVTAGPAEAGGPPPPC